MGWRGAVCVRFAQFSIGYWSAGMLERRRSARARPFFKRYRIWRDSQLAGAHSRASGNPPSFLLETDALDGRAVLLGLPRAERAAALALVEAQEGLDLSHFFHSPKSGQIGNPLICFAASEGSAAPLGALPSLAPSIPERARGCRPFSQRLRSFAVCALLAFGGGMLWVVGSLLDSAYRRERVHFLRRSLKFGDSRVQAVIFIAGGEAAIPAGACMRP